MSEEERPPPPPPAAGAHGAGPLPYGYPPPGTYYPAGQRTEGTAVAALVFAIASFVTCFVLAIVALVLAQQAKQKIDASGGALGGESLAQAASIVAWINIGLWLLGIAVTIVVIVVAVATAPDTEVSLVLASR